MIAEILAWFLAVALHEFGHWLACKLNGWQPKIGFAVKGLKTGFCVKFTIPEEELENVNFESLWFKLSKVYLTALLFSLAPFYFGTCIHVIDPYAACIGMFLFTAYGVWEATTLGFTIKTTFSNPFKRRVKITGD